MAYSRRPWPQRQSGGTLGDVRDIPGRVFSVAERTKGPTQHAGGHRRPNKFAGQKIAGIRMIVEDRERVREALMRGEDPATVVARIHPATDAFVKRIELFRLCREDRNTA